MPRLLRLIRIERIRAFTLSDELEKAAEEIQAAGLAGNIEATGAVDEADWAMRQGSTAVTLARFLTRSRRAEQALALLGQAEKRALRGGQMLAVAKLRVLRATAHWQLRQRSEAIQALCDSIRLLGKQAFRRFILDEGPPALAILQAALDKGRLVGGLNPQVRKKLAELNHRFTVGDLEPRRVPVRRRRARHPQQQADLRSPHYIQLLATGLSNKEIARTLGVSPNTVKYHLKRIFSELHVDSRNRAVFRARELGIIDS